MVRRKIIQIDEDKCDGCGLCVPSCAEGALQIIDGKARLVADTFCDGLGACLGECPRGAIQIIERDAEAFDAEAVAQHQEHSASRQAPHSLPEVPTSSVRDSAETTLPQATAKKLPCGCPSVMVQSLLPQVPPKQHIERPSLSTVEPQKSEASGLVNWPVQLHLVPPHAPFLKQADILLTADCVPVALPDFSRRVLRGRPLLLGCPKLDDAEAYVEKLTAILQEASPMSLTILHMEVPCCSGLLRIAQEAKKRAGSDLPLHEMTVSIRGEIVFDSTGFRRS